jgi:phenylalanyl-tRNA synthetase alpha chain
VDAAADFLGICIGGIGDECVRREVAEETDVADEAEDSVSLFNAIPLPHLPPLHFCFLPKDTNCSKTENPVLLAPMASSPLTADSLEEYLKSIDTAESLQALDEIEQDVFGRKSGALTLAMKELGSATPDERKVKGKELNDMKDRLTQALEAKKMSLKQASLSSLSQTDRLDLTLDLPSKEHGHLHLIPEFIEQVKEVFGRMGFAVAEGPEMDTEQHNFDLLNFPKDHAARDSQDIFYLDVPPEGDSRYLLRGHTSTVQVRYMKEHKPPFRIICPGKVYRKDADATHSPMFHQFEGLMVGKGITLANMKAVMMAAIRELISPKAEFRFRTGYFPFVEPGLEVDMRWQGDEEKSREGKWLEICGCGMVHPKVLENCGIDPNEWQGFAFGFGVERMIMIKHQIPDLRSFYQGDLRFLNQF